MIVEKKHNYFYKITNLITGKFYYGIHSTNDLDDGYFGSGTALKSAVKKYGIDSFKKEIICDYKTRKDVSDHEGIVVTVKMINNENSYNLRTGGDNEYIFNHSEETKKKISKSSIGKIFSEVTKKKLRDLQLGKTRSEITKKRISDSKIGKKLGENHPNAKKCSINGNIFPTFIDVARVYKITRNTVARRIKSNSLKFKNWKLA